MATTEFGVRLAAVATPAMAATTQLGARLVVVATPELRPRHRGIWYFGGWDSIHTGGIMEMAYFVLEWIF